LLDVVCESMQSVRWMVGRIGFGRALAATTAGASKRAGSCSSKIVKIGEQRSAKGQVER
jgi:hypothetical protein